MSISDRNNIKFGTIISVVTMISSVVLHIFYTPFLLNHVGSERYGIYSFATSVTNWFTIVLGALASSYNKFATEKKANDQNDEKNINGVYFILFVFLSLLTVLVSTLFLVLLSTQAIKLDNYDANEQKLIVILLFISITQVVILILSRVFTLNIMLHNKFIWVKGISLFAGILSSVCCIPFLIIGKGIITVALVSLFINAAACILDIVFDVRVLKIGFKFPRDKKYLKDALKTIGAFSAVIFLDEISAIINTSLDKAVLGFKGYKNEVTHYALAYSIFYIAKSTVALLPSTLNPKINENTYLKEYESNFFIFNFVSFFQLLIWMLILGGFISCGKEFILLWVGEDHLISYYVCGVLLITNIVPATQSCATEILRSQNKHRKRAYIVMGTTILNALITIILVNVLPQEQAIVGCLIGTAISLFLGDWIILSIYNSKAIKMPMGTYWLSLAKFALITATGIGVVLLMDRFLFSNMQVNILLLLFIKGLLFAAVFATLVLLLFKKNLKESFAVIKGLKNPK